MESRKTNLLPLATCSTAAVVVEVADTSAIVVVAAVAAVAVDVVAASRVCSGFFEVN